MPRIQKKSSQSQVLWRPTGLSGIPLVCWMSGSVAAYNNNNKTWNSEPQHLSTTLLNNCPQRQQQWEIPGSNSAPPSPPNFNEPLRIFIKGYSRTTTTTAVPSANDLSSLKAFFLFPFSSSSCSSSLSHHWAPVLRHTLGGRKEDRPHQQSRRGFNCEV